MIFWNFINYILCMALLTHATKTATDDAGYKFVSEYLNKGHVHCQVSWTMKTATIESKILDKIYKDVFESTETVPHVSYNLELPDFKNSNISRDCLAYYFVCNQEDKLNCVQRQIILEVAPREYNDDTILRVIPKEAFQFLSDAIDIPVGRKISRRQLRQAGTCSFPSSLETAAIHCKTFPSFVQCVQRCAFGYTLEDGIRREMVCKHSENKWVPNGFKECKPFVDCTVSLISGGSLSCTSMNIMQGPECKIECQHYEDKDAIAKTSYICNIDGEWNPSLPFCAAPHSGLALVETPKNKLHYANFN